MIFMAAVRLAPEKAGDDTGRMCVRGIVRADIGRDEGDDAEIPADNVEEQEKTETDSTLEADSAADPSYLDGALFIGDSRTVMLKDYAGWDNCDFFAEVGLTIWNIFEQECVEADGEKITIDAALQRWKYDKIYIQLGINELGRGTADSFCEQYSTVLSRIRELQPDAVIYLQSILHVSKQRDAKGDYINNAEVNNRNNKLRELADGRSIFWLDLNAEFDDPSTEALNEEYTSDGVHLKATCIPAIQDFLLRHAAR